MFLLCLSVHIGGYLSSWGGGVPVWCQVWLGGTCPVPGPVGGYMSGVKSSAKSVEGGGYLSSAKSGGGQGAGAGGYLGVTDPGSEPQGKHRDKPGGRGVGSMPLRSRRRTFLFLYAINKLWLANMVPNNTHLS